MLQEPTHQLPATAFPLLGIWKYEAQLLSAVRCRREPI
jgi:hypothetical protein